MSAKKFRFVSPGIFLNEIDNSQLPSEPRNIGPLVIGRTQKGPAMRPVQVDSFSDFVDVFGEPHPGGDGTDVWRNGNLQAPTYAAYAAQAWLKNSPTINVVRLLGKEHVQKTTDAGEAGWKTTYSLGTAADDQGGAYGLWVFPAELSTSGSATGTITCDDGDAVDMGDQEGKYVKFTATDGTVGIFILSDASEPDAVASGTVLTATSDLGSSAPDTDLLAQGTCIAVTCNLNTNSQATVLNEFKDTIGAGTSPILAKITGGTITGTGDGNQSITFTQATLGFAGNTTITTNVGKFDAAGFTGGRDGGTGHTQATGSLAAVWYVPEGYVGLTGTDTNNATITAARGQLVLSNDSGDFTLEVKDSAGATDKKIAFNLSAGSKNSVRKVFNTNPALTNGTITNSTEKYWLGESYEYEFAQDAKAPDAGGVNNKGVGGVVSSSSDGVPNEVSATYAGVILGLGPADSSTATSQHGSRRIGFSQAQDAAPYTGWFFSQDLGGGSVSGSYAYDNMQKLFRLHALDHGAWVQNNIKVSISKIKYSSDDFNKYGTFDVEIRRIDDTDKAPVILEKFSNCDLNPNSLNYVARKIGDSYVTYDTTERRLVEKGQYPNISKYVRIQMNVDVDSGAANEEYLPFGVYGPSKYKDFNHEKGAVASGAGNNWTETAAYAWGWYDVDSRNVGIPPAAETVPNAVSSSHPELGVSTALSFRFPKLQTRISSSQDDLASVKQAYFGAWTGRSKDSSKFNPGVRDLIRTKAEDLNGTDSGDYTEYMWKFSLDEIRGEDPVYDGNADISTNFVWEQGLRTQSNLSADKDVYAVNSVTATGSYKDILDLNVRAFTSTFYGGSDGFDITEKEPFRNSRLDDAGTTEKTSYEFNSIKEAIDIVSDVEVVEFNLAAVPGLTHEGLTSHLIETVEARADALAVVDLKGDFAPAAEGSTGITYGSVNTVVTNLKARALNSSYACVYYPWVQIRDTLYGNLVYMPPSVAAIGAMSYTDRVRAPWFAPAGFNRGGLSSGVAGLPVVNVTQKLTSKDRDDLYEANINPIASFPNEGIVIFGQKTLQVTRSALDRINVRRLLLFVKKGISTISADVLFEPNLRETWDRFIARAEPFLADVKARFGLTDYKLILDETTTTPDLVDQNIMYAKVFLKPARAIEFIAVDFIITNTGAAFED